MISIIIPSRNNLKDLKRTIRSLVADKTGHEVLVVDDQSVDGSVEWLRQKEWVTTLQGEGTRAALMNVGAKAATGSTLLFITPGVVLERGWASTAVEAGSQSGFKFGGFRLDYDFASLAQEWRAASLFDKGEVGAKVLLLKLAAWIYRCRSLQWPVWNQGLLVDRSFFSETGGFLDMPICADLEWTHRMGKQGTRAKRLACACINSIRPFQRDGFWTRLYRDEKTVSAFFRGKGVKELRAIQEGENNAVLVLYRGNTPGSLPERLKPYLPDANLKKIGDALVRHTLRIAETSWGSPKTLLSAVPEAGDGNVKQLFGSEVLVEFQRGNGLGEQLQGAMHKEFEAGLEKVILIDPICPQLDKDIIAKAIFALDEVDVVLGPTDDGECYLIGCRSGFEDVLAKVDWSAESSFQTVASTVRANGGRSKTLPRLRDLDNEEDYREFYNLGFIQY